VPEPRLSHKPASRLISLLRLAPAKEPWDHPSIISPLFCNRTLMDSSPSSSTMCQSFTPPINQQLHHCLFMSRDGGMNRVLPSLSGGPKSAPLPGRTLTAPMPSSLPSAAPSTRLVESINVCPALASALVIPGAPYPPEGHPVSVLPPVALVWPQWHSEYLLIPAARRKVQDHLPAILVSSIQVCAVGEDHLCRWFAAPCRSQLQHSQAVFVFRCEPVEELRQQCF